MQENQNKNDIILKCVIKLLEQEKPSEFIIDVIAVGQKEDHVFDLLHKWYRTKSPEEATNILIDLAYQTKTHRRYYG